MFQAFWMKPICGLMCGTAPRCSTSSPTSLPFVVSGAVRFATSEPQNSGTPGMSRRHDHHVHGLTLATLASQHPRISWFVLRQPKGRSNFCSVARLQWFTLITNSSTKTDWLDLTVYFQNTIRTCNVYTCLHISMKILELWNSWFLCFSCFIKVISCHLNSIPSPLSIAAVPRPGRTSPCWGLNSELRIFSRSRHPTRTFPSSNPPNTHAPLPGRLTNQSCKVRKCALEQKKKTSLVASGAKNPRKDFASGTVRNIKNLLRRATSALRAVPSFWHSAAAQPRSATRSSAAQGSRGVAEAARTGDPWNSPRRSFWWHIQIQTSSKIHISSIIHHPSSRSSRSSCFHHLSTCFYWASKSRSQEASKWKTCTPRGRWVIKSSNCWSLKCRNPAKDSCTSLGVRLDCSNLSLVMPICMAPVRLNPKLLPSASHWAQVSSGKSNHLLMFNIDCSFELYVL